MGEALDVLVDPLESVDLFVTDEQITIEVVGEVGPPGPPGADGEPGPPVFVGADPPPDPEVGQLWFDVDDPHTAEVPVTISATAPTLPDGSLWYDSSSPALYVRVSGAWVGV